MELLEPLPLLPWEPIVIAATGDIQAGSSGTDWDCLARYIDKAMKRNAYFVGTGDYVDFLSPSNRRALMMAGLYDTAMELIDWLGWDGPHVQRLRDVLAPTKGRWLELVEGHHFYNFSPIDTTDTRLAKYLGCRFAGTSSLLRLNFRGEPGQSTSCKILTVHGEGKGYGFLLRLRPGFPDVDVFIKGHSCERENKPVACIDMVGKPGKLRMRSREQRLVLAGSFFRGYAEGSTLGEFGRPMGSYVEKAGMEPLPIGGQFITITPVAKDGYSMCEVEVSG